MEGWPKNWEMGSDGMPEHKNRDPDCKRCNGHGLLDDGGDYGCLLVPCPCTETKRKEVRDV